MSLVCISLVYFAAAFGGILTDMLHGYKFSWPFNILINETKPIITKFIIPDLLGQLVFGFLVMNLFPKLMEDYNSKWSEYIRMVCLTVILLRGGMHIDFKDKGFYKYY